MESVFDEIKARLTIAAVCRRYGVDIKMRGGDKLFAVCPFHREKTPSFAIYERSNSFYCFGCGAAGSVIDFAAKYHNLEPLPAARLLDADFNLGLFELAGTPAEKAKRAGAARERLRDKGLAQDYDTWERQYINYLCGSIALLEELQEAAKPYLIEGEPVFPADYGEAINKRQIMEYHRDILLDGGMEDKISLYLAVNGTKNNTYSEAVNA